MRVDTHCVYPHLLRVGAGRHRRTRHPQQKRIINHPTRFAHYGYQTLPPSPHQIPPRRRYLRTAYLPARRVAPLLAGVADDGHPVCADVYCGNRYDGQEP